MRTLHPLRLLLLASMFYLPWAGAQNYPSKPIRLQTSAAGGATDLLARILANEFNPVFGQSVIVENQSNPALLGGSVAKAVPDGHTLLVWGPGFWVGPLFQEVPYDVMRDFQSISMLTRSPAILVVTASLPVKSVADLIALAKSKPGELNYLMGANGSSEHVASELLKSLSGTNIVRVPYKGGVVSGVPDLLSGRVQMVFSSGAIWDPHIKAGKARLLATGGGKRSALYPDVPTVAETLPGFAAESILGFWAPAKVPGDIVKRLNTETIKAFDKADVRQRLLSAGQEPSTGAPALLTEAISADLARIGKMIKDGSLSTGG